MSEAVIYKLGIIFTHNQVNYYIFSTQQKRSLEVIAILFIFGYKGIIYNYALVNSSETEDVTEFEENVDCRRVIGHVSDCNIVGGHLVGSCIDINPWVWTTCNDDMFDFSLVVIFVDCYHSILEGSCYKNGYWACGM